jgi:hypothetical protein
MSYIGRGKQYSAEIQNKNEDKEMKKNVTNMIRLAVVAAVLITVISVQGTDAQNRGGGRLEGTWDARVSITDCQTGNVLRSFDSLGIFMSGGTMIDSTSGVPQAFKTPGQGVWRHVKGNTYQMRFKSFTFSPQNTFTGWTIIEHEVTLDASGDTYTSAGTAAVYNALGAQIGGGCSTTTATRFDFQ